MQNILYRGHKRKITCTNFQKLHLFRTNTFNYSSISGGKSEPGLEYCIQIEKKKKRKVQSCQRPVSSFHINQNEQSNIAWGKTYGRSIIADSCSNFQKCCKECSKNQVQQQQSSRRSHCIKQKQSNVEIKQYMQLVSSSS